MFTSLLPLGHVLHQQARARHSYSRVSKCCCTRNKLNSQTSLVEQFAYITQEMGREEVLLMYSCATLDILTMQSRVRVVGWLRQWTTCGREPATRSPHPVTRAMIHHHHLLVVMRMTIREANSEVVQKRGAGGDGVGVQLLYD